MKSLLDRRSVARRSEGRQAGSGDAGRGRSARGAGRDPPGSRRANAPKPETRVVVVGDSDFASNGVLGIQGNRDLFMNMVGWLSQQENLISIRPKEAAIGV